VWTVAFPRDPCWDPGVNSLNVGRYTCIRAPRRQSSSICRRQANLRRHLTEWHQWRAQSSTVCTTALMKSGTGLRHAGLSWVMAMRNSCGLANDHELIDWPTWTALWPSVLASSSPLTSFRIAASRSTQNSAWSNTSPKWLQPVPTSCGDFDKCIVSSEKRSSLNWFMHWSSRGLIMDTRFWLVSRNRRLHHCCASKTLNSTWACYCIDSDS